MTCNKRQQCRGYSKQLQTYTPKCRLHSLTGVRKGVSRGSSLQLGQLAAKVWWEQVWPCGCPLTPFNKGRPCPFQSPHYQVQPALPLQAQPNCKRCCQACWGEEQEQVACSTLIHSIHQSAITFLSCEMCYLQALCNALKTAQARLFTAIRKQWALCGVAFDMGTQDDGNACCLLGIMLIL